MTAGFAHDLRTPLTSIKGYAEGLRDGIANTPEKQQRYLQTIYDSAVQTEKILDDLLALSSWSWAAQATIAPLCSYKRCWMMLRRS